MVLKNLVDAGYSLLLVHIMLNHWALVVNHTALIIIVPIFNMYNLLSFSLLILHMLKLFHLSQALSSSPQVNLLFLNVNLHLLADPLNSDDFSARRLTHSVSQNVLLRLCQWFLWFHSMNLIRNHRVIVLPWFMLFLRVW